MKVLTKNPVVVNGRDVSPNDYYSSAAGDVAVDFDYLPTEEVTADDLKVVTKYPIVLDGADISPRDYYSNAAGVPALSPTTLAALQEMSAKTGKEPSAKDQAAAKEKGLFWDNLKKSWQAFSTSDAGKLALNQIDAALTARREAKYGSGQGGAYLPSDQAGAGTQSAPMSTTTKVLLIGGGLVVVGLILYSAFAGKPATK